MVKRGSKAKIYILLIAALTGVLLFLFLGQVSASIGKDSVTVESTLASSVTINYSDIANIELWDVASFGTPSFAISTRKVISGKYGSAAFGPYTLFVYKDVKKYIYIQHNDNILLFNLASEEETITFFKQISEIIGKLAPADSNQNTTT